MPNLPWVEAIKARVEKATPGPWATQQCSGVGIILRRGESLGPNAHEQGHLQVFPVEDGVLMANAPSDLSRLLRAVEVLGEAVEKIAARPCVFAGTNSECSKASDGFLCAYCAARRALADVREG